MLVQNIYQDFKTLVESKQEIAFRSDSGRVLGSKLQQKYWILWAGRDLLPSTPDAYNVTFILLSNAEFSLDFEQIIPNDRQFIYQIYGISNMENFSLTKAMKFYKKDLLFAATGNNILNTNGLDVFLAEIIAELKQIKQLYSI